MRDQTIYRSYICEGQTGRNQTHKTKTLFKCGHPPWTFRLVRESLDNKQPKEEKNKRRRRRGLIRYRPSPWWQYHMWEGSETSQRTFRRYGVATSVKPYKTWRQLLVHPKDKRSAQDLARVVYSIPCKDCPKVYIGETGKRYGVREKEHMKDVKQLEGVNYTRTKKRESLTEHHLCADRPCSSL